MIDNFSIQNICFCNKNYFNIIEMISDVSKKLLFEIFLKLTVDLTSALAEVVD